MDAMKVQVKPLYAKLNEGLGQCPLGCQSVCKVREQAPEMQPPDGCSCPLYDHQAQTYALTTAGDTDIIFNRVATGGGKSLGATLPALLPKVHPDFRVMGLYPTIELVEDQYRQQQEYHQMFGLNAEKRVDRLYGAELARRISEKGSNRFQELLKSIEQKPVIQTNPDIFHYITHFRYRDNARSQSELPMVMAKFPDLWVFDEFHIFGEHQMAAALNSLLLIRHATQSKRKFLFTSATPKTSFVESLKNSGFKIAEIQGEYSDRLQQGYRQILQTINLEFVHLKDTDTESWLLAQSQNLRNLLHQEKNGRGLIIVNSVAAAGRLCRNLSKILPDVEVREISGRCDRQERQRTQNDLRELEKPVLVVATSAVDVGVDFKIHLLICESSDSATVIQRLGRLGRHAGFQKYQAYVLIPSQTQWIIASLKQELEEGSSIDRLELSTIIETAFNAPQEFKQYQKRWGELQVQGMLHQMVYGGSKSESKDNLAVTQELRDRMIVSLERVYQKEINGFGRWWGLGNDAVGKATQEELLRFRGGSSLQSGIWDGDRFYSYDLLKVLPYATVEVIDRETFLEAAQKSKHGIEEFPEQYLTSYFKITKWLDQRLNLSLFSTHSHLVSCQLMLLDRLQLKGHIQTELSRCLGRSKYLVYLVPVNRNNPSSHWDISRKLRLSPLFGLYRLTDSGGNAYGCAFNHDALLLEALKWRLGDFCKQATSESLIF
ncbi:conserved hypothetical protein, helicase domain (plasmid) [Picosynechococcus sp. PCC 7002]|nr:conserved hypothetical protein, helicase domain [Picosynechococcus sp. PCC 7002]